MTAEIPTESAPVETPEQPESQAPASQESEGQGFYDEEKTVEAEKPSPEESAPSETDESESENESDESVASSEEAVEPETEKKADPKHIRELKKLRFQNRKYRELLQQQQAQAPQPLNMPKEPKPPDINTFEGTADEFAAAQEQFKKDYAEYVKVSDRVERQRQQAEETQKKRDAEIKENWTKQEQRIKRENPDFDTVQYLQLVRPNPTVDGFLATSQVGAEMLNYLADNLEEAERINAMEPFAAARAIAKIELAISDQVKGIIRKPAAKVPQKVKGQVTAPSAPKSTADLLYG